MEHHTQGVTLGAGDGASPEVFTDIPQITSISGFGTTRSEIDTTDLADGSKTFILGLKDNGLNYDPDNAVHSGLRTKNQNGTLDNYKLTLSDASPAVVFNFAAYVMEFSIDIAVDDVLKATATLRISGDVT